MHNFKDLIVWQKSVAFVKTIYSVTKEFPSSERHNLISQMQRAATSKPLNIAEGCGRHTNPMFKHFLSNALGSSYELETTIVISSNLGYISEFQNQELLEALHPIQKMLNRLMDTLS